MTSGQEVKIGPWPEGLNLLDNPDQIRDTQCPWIINFDVNNSGTLSPRRSLKFTYNDNNAPLYLLGTVDLSGFSNEQQIIVASFSSGTSNIKAIRKSDSTSIHTLISFTGSYRSVVQYQDRLWFIPSDGVSIGRWTSASSTDLAATSVAAMPYGDYGFILKDRLFIVRKLSSEIYFSKATDFTSWTAPDGGVIKINPGDNKPITKVIVLNNQIVIFKRDETFILSFNNNPTGDGSVRLVAPDQGAFDAVSYNNEIFCYNSRSVFKFINGYFQDIASQLNFRESTGLERFQVSNTGKMHIVGNTLILGIGLYSPEVRTFAMNLDTGAWSNYEFDNEYTNLFEVESVAGRNPTEGKFTVFGSGRQNLFSMLVEKRTGSGNPDINRAKASIPIKYEFFTKVLDFNDRMVWKRLFKWYIDIRFRGENRGGTVSLSINSSHNPNTFRPTPTVSATAVGDLIGSTKSARFRTIQFGYSSYTVDAPQISAIKALIGIKAPVSKGMVAIR